MVAAAIVNLSFTTHRSHALFLDDVESWSSLIPTAFSRVSPWMPSSSSSEHPRRIDLIDSSVPVECRCGEPHRGPRCGARRNVDPWLLARGSMGLRSHRCAGPPTTACKVDRGHIQRHDVVCW